MIPILPSRLVALFVLAACATALASAFVAEYGFGLRPCILCLTQRVPFVLAGGLAAASLLHSVRPWRRGLLAVAALALLVNSGIAFYHVGVEQKWWASSCAPSAGAPLEVLDIAALTKPVEARCDEPAWAWHGITMAGLNIVFSGGLALVVFALIRRREAP